MDSPHRRAPRRAASLALLAAALVPGAAEAAAPIEEEFPGRAALAPFPRKSPWLRNYVLPYGRAAIEAPAARLAKRVAGEDVVFVDIDGNGRFGDVGVDGWTVEGNDYVVPLDETLVVGAREVAVRFAEDGKEVRFKATAIAGDPEVLAGVALMNSLRLGNGLPPVGLDPELSRACASHARYCNIHGITHDQVKGNAGYTEEGARAGRASSVGGAASAADAVSMLYCQFYHRFSITHPDTRRIGLGMAGSTFALDGVSGRKRRLWKWPVVIPSPGTTAQPRAFDTSESPRAYPGEMQPGFPMTIQFENAETREVEAELRAGPKGGVLPILVSWPGNPAHERFTDNFFAICVIPRARLASRTRHEFKVSWTHRGRADGASGVFTTGDEMRPAAGKR
jgi:hypothetical protein